VQASRFAPVGVFLAAFLLYAPSFGALFAVLDFNHLDAIRSTDATTYFLRIFDPSNGGRTIIGTGDLYRPIYYTVFWFEYQAFGTDPFPYYVFNAAMHGANAALVYFLARRLTGSDVASVAGALIWGFHAQYAEAIVWISSTTDLLLVFFGLIAVLSYAKALDLEGGRRAAMLGVAFASVLLALGAKETGAVLVPILAGYHVLVGEPDLLHKPRVPWELAPFLAILLFYFPLRVFLVGNLATANGNEVYSLDVFAHIHTMASFVAAPLVGGTTAIHEFSVAQGAVGIAIVAAIALAALLGSRREWFLAGWFFVAMVPVLIFPEVWLVGRYLYLPFVGVAILAGIGLEKLLVTVSARSSVAAFAAAAAVMLAIVVWLGVLNFDYQDELTSRGEEAGAFLTSLKETYPEPPASGRLIVTEHPRSLSFAENDGMMLVPAVRVAYDADVEVVTQWHLNRGEAPPTDSDVWYPPQGAQTAAQLDP